MTGGHGKAPRNPAWHPHRAREDEAECLFKHRHIYVLMYGILEMSAGREPVTMATLQITQNRHLYTTILGLGTFFYGNKFVENLDD